MNEITKLAQRFEEMGVTKFNVFPGTNPSTTPEQIAKEVNDMLDQLESGEFEEI